MVENKEYKLGDLLDEAKEIITKDRMDAYGKPEDCFQCIAEFWIVWDKWKNPMISKEMDVAMKNILQQIAREAMNIKRDNLKDISGYASIYADKLANKTQVVEPPQEKNKCQTSI